MKEPIIDAANYSLEGDGKRSKANHDLGYGR